MKKLKVIDGGMPLKIDDLDLIQDACFDAVQAILQSLLPGTNSFILTGCESSIGGGNISITAGVIYVDGEIYYVPSAIFTYDAGKQLYLEENFSTSENRTFHDTSTNDVWDIRVYAFGYDTEVPEGAIGLSTMFTLRTLLDSEITSGISGNADLTGFYTLSYLTGFTKATSWNGIRLEGNSFNGYMLLGAFTATASAGKVATLPVGMRPTGDLVGFFFTNAVAPGILKIKSNGDIYVSGASTTGTNYISFQFYMRFEDPILHSLPASGGGALPDGDGV
jgi:hypothetical protein